MPQQTPPTQSPTITNNHQQHIQPQQTPRLPCSTYPQRVPQHAGVDGAKPTGQTLHQRVPPAPRQRGVHVAQTRGGVQAGRTGCRKEWGKEQQVGKEQVGEEQVETNNKWERTSVSRVTIENEYNQ